jgi:hypothetical protein
VIGVKAAAYRPIPSLTLSKFFLFYYIIAVAKSSFLLFSSPLVGEARVRGDRKKLLAISIDRRFLDYW